MAHLQYYSYPGFGEAKRAELWYSQAVRVGDYIEISGQGGWDPETSKIPTDLDEEIDQAFANVDHTLKHAGGKGWSQVYKVRIYLTDLGETSLVAAVRNLKKWSPDHQPTTTCLGVNQLALPGMRVEIEVIAHDEEGAKVAAAAKVEA